MQVANRVDEFCRGDFLKFPARNSNQVGSGNSGRSHGDNPSQDKGFLAAAEALVKGRGIPCNLTSPNQTVVVPPMPASSMVDLASTVSVQNATATISM